MFAYVAKVVKPGPICSVMSSLEHKAENLTNKLKIALMIAMMMPTGHIINTTKRRYQKVKTTASLTTFKIIPFIEIIFKPKVSCH